MKDDKKLQCLLLRMIAESGYWADHDDLIVKAGVKRIHSRLVHFGNPSCPTAEQIQHQFKLLEEKGAIKKTVVTPYIRYEITALGHAWLKPWYQKLGAMLGKQLSTILTAAITSVIVFVLTEVVKRMLFN
jgi:hypothetical protein